jgi:endonuclease YncB( thermonuclease family)
MSNPSWPEVVGQGIPVRLAGCDAPELSAEDPNLHALAERSRDAVRHIMEHATTIELRDIKRGMYFRLVANVVVDGVPLCPLLIRQGLARPYDGGKHPW